MRGEYKTARKRIPLNPVTKKPVILSDFVDLKTSVAGYSG
jgi:hypothetical protein